MNKCLQTPFCLCSRRLHFACVALSALEGWSWSSWTNSSSHCSLKTLGSPPRWKWNHLRETPTAFPSTTGSLTATCTASEREQVCVNMLVWHLVRCSLTTEHKKRTFLNLVVVLSLRSDNLTRQPPSWQIQSSAGAEGAWGRLSVRAHTHFNFMHPKTSIKPPPPLVEYIFLHIHACKGDKK